MKELNYDLDQGMIKELSEEFDPEDFVKSLEISKPEEIGDAEPSFEDYGRRLAKRSIEMGEKKPDRTLKILKEVMEKTGELEFPLLPQRYVELAYLSTQPFKRLWIYSNSSKVFSYKLDDCNVYNAIKEELGEKAAKKMACKSACLAILEEAFSHFDLDIKTSMETNMAEDGKCEFKVEKK